MKTDCCRFPVGNEGRLCGRVGRVARMRVDNPYEIHVDAKVEAHPVRDARGNPYLYCLEHWHLMHDPQALAAHYAEMRRKASAARYGRRSGRSKLAYRYEREARVQ